MFKKIAVPLDGSALAEKALPFAIQLANSMDAGLLLIRATKVPSLLTDTPAHELEYLETAEVYFETIKNSITNPALENHIAAEKLETLVVYGDTVAEIVEITPFEKADLVVMTTHGRSGLSRMVMGSVAKKVLRQSQLPVIVMRPENLQTSELIEETLLENAPTTKSVVVTLDGTADAEAILEPAIELAQKLGATVNLLEVVVPSIPVEYGAGFYGIGFDLDTDTRKRIDTAKEYLAKLKVQLSERGINCASVVKVGNAATEIVEYTQAIQASLIAMATHARGTVGEFLIGSVADEVMRKSHLPVVMVHTTSHHNQDKSKKSLIAGKV
jgi:nucleotide-binding universal stress UspA family protein